MNNIKHLIEVLKSQITLYAELAEVIAAEKESIIKWDVDETIRLTQKKEALLNKEKIQEKARNALLEKIAIELGLDSVKLYDVVRLAATEEQKEILGELGEKLVELVTTIHAENLSLRMLYSTNNKLINEFFFAAGLSESASYNSQGSSGSQSSGVKITTLKHVVG